MKNKINMLMRLFAAGVVPTLLWVGPALAESPIPEKLYYDHPLSAYEQAFSYSNPHHMSHPPYYTAEVRLLAGPYGQEYAIRTHSTGFYGLNPVTLTLYLSSGLMHLRAEEGMPPTMRELDLNPPDQRFSDYFLYRAKLKRMAEDLEFLRDDGKPELAQAIAYVRAVDNDVAQLTDVLGAQLPFEIRPGQTYDIAVTCKTAAPRDVLVDFLDGSKWYTGARVTLPQQGESVKAQLSVTIPRELADPKSAYLSVKLVPVGAPWQSRLFEKDQSTAVLPTEEIIYFWGTYVYTKQFRISYKVVTPDPRELIVEVEDPRGQVVLTQSFPVEAGETSGSYVELPNLGVELNQSYRLRAYLVPRGATPKAALDEASYEAFTYSP